MFLGLHSRNTDPSKLELDVCPAMNTLVDAELPHDLAKQALAATGGKSTLRATEWILNMKAGVQLVGQPSCWTWQQQQGRTEQHVSSTAFPGSPLDLPAFEEDLLPLGEAEDAGDMSQKQCGNAKVETKMPPPLSTAMEWIGSNALEIPLSIGSCSHLEKQSENGDGPLAVKSLKPALGPPSVEVSGKSLKLARPTEAGDGQLLGKASKPCYSPEVGEGAKALNLKAARLSPTLQDANPKRQRQVEPETIGKPIVSPFASASLLKLPCSSTGKVIAPLAERMRPTSIGDILGQEHLLGPQCVLRSLLDNETLPCIIFWGPPGTGKTSLARLIARSASCRFVALSPAKSGVSEVQEILDEARQAKKFGHRTLLFVESLNRFQRFQQEAVLPAIEAGYVVLIGASMENPASEVVSALLLRCRVFTLKKLRPEHLRKVMDRAIADKERGVIASVTGVPGVESVTVDDEALRFLAHAADGDARIVLSALEAAVTVAVSNEHIQKRSESDGHTTRSEVDGSALIKKESPMTLASIEREKVMTGAFSGKRDSQLNVLEHLKGNFQFSQEVYSKPFKKIVGGREMVSHGMLNNKEREPQKLSCEAEKEGKEVGFVGSGSGKVEEGRETGGLERKGVGAAAYAATAAVVVQGLGNATTHAEFEMRVVVTMADVKEALQWSHLLHEKASEDSIKELITALQKSIRGGDGNAAIYWLARILKEGDQWALNLAESFVRFASEEVGLADPQALVQSVACYQACQLLGMPGCTAHLTQCVAYLSMAPKSAALLEAIESAQNVVRDCEQDEPVPLYLRSGPPGLVKELGYLPPSLRDHTFLHWPDF